MRLPRKDRMSDAFISVTGRVMVELSAAIRAKVDWVTERDEKVCDICDDNEDEGPYTPEDVPRFPAHPRCRCSLLPVLK